MDDVDRVDVHDSLDHLADYEGSHVLAQSFLLAGVLV